MDSNDTPKRMQVNFSGRVQGVGFRYAVCRVAETFTVAGYVRNLPDGSVEVVAEGAEQALSDFLNGIRSAPIGRYVAKEQAGWVAATGQYGEFGVSV